MLASCERVPAPGRRVVINHILSEAITQPQTWLGLSCVKCFDILERGRVSARNGRQHTRSWKKLSPVKCTCSGGVLVWVCVWVALAKFNCDRVRAVCP